MVLFHVPDRTPITRRRLLTRTVLGAAAITLGDLAVDSQWIEVVRKQVRVANWRGGKVKVGFLTDPHLNSEGAVDLALHAIEQVRHEKLDVLLLGGDYLNFAHHRQNARLTALAERVRSLGIPTAAVLGNHDYSSGQIFGITKAFEDHGVRLLRDQGLDLDGFQIFGYDDAFFGNYQPNALNKDDYPHSTIALLHEPDFVKDVPRHASLQLSGHSHGGQVCLPFGIATHTPNGARKYVAGLYQTAPVPLYVSRGIGTTGLPIRLFCRPEMTVLEIQSA